MNKGILLIFLVTLSYTIAEKSIYSSSHKIDASIESEIVQTLRNYEEQKNNIDFTSIMSQQSEEQAKLYEQLRLLNEDKKNNDEIFEPIDNSCENRKQHGNIGDFYYFLPNVRAILKAEGDNVEFSNDCFKSSSIKIVSLGSNEIEVELEVNNSTSLTCSDSYLLTTSLVHHPIDVFVHGKHKITITNLKESDINEIKVNGIRLLGFCEGALKSIYSLYDTLKLYLGGFSTKHSHVTNYMKKANLDFIKRYVGLDYKDRGEASKKILDIKKEIKSGDFVAIVRLDGLDELIMMGTGSSIGHTCVAVWIDNELYVVESQDGWYWPKHGIQRNKFDEWVQYAFNADFNVVIVPLKPEAREKLNVEKSLEWFYSVEGLNYGYHNFLFSWLDTHKNFPSYMDNEIFLPLFGIFAQVSSSTFSLIAGEGLNMRVGTKGLPFNEILNEAAKKNLTFEDLITIPEQQGWKYSDGENYVCSCFCAGFYKAGGLFDDLEIQPQEFTPKDIYQLNFFDTNYNKPEVCKEADPETPYCQIMGSNRVVFRGVGTINPYNKMNQRCESQAPDFIRNEGC